MYYLSTINMGDISKTKVVRVDADGSVWWLGLGEDDTEYLAWVADGNTAEEWIGN